MTTKLVTCPETAHIEAVDFLSEPDGELLLVVRCSRFDPPEDVACDWLCLKRLNCSRAREQAQAEGTTATPDVTDR